MTADLKKSLRIMHHFHMIHHDIKPENIAFSPHFNKWVFIDYGLSTVIEEKLGDKSMVKFLGTYQFTTEEMRATLSQKGLVDLYFNDLHGLRESIRKTEFLEKYNIKPQL
jgi:serine/threonine protein kinase